MPDSFELPNNVITSVPEPMVTVRTSTFQHASFIRRCIEGVLMQRTSYPFEYIIGEDCSTDGTREIVFDYAKRYPDVIRVVTANYNVGARKNARRCRDASRGKYIALCDGDDYWTDPSKLQKQVEVLEGNPDFSVCVGGFVRLYDDSGEELSRLTRIRSTESPGKGYVFTLKDTYRRWLTQPLTAMFPRSLNEHFDLSQYKYARDVHLFYHLLQLGYGFYIAEHLGVHRMHSGGLHSMKSRSTKIRNAVNIYCELHDINKDQFSRIKYLYSLADLFNQKLYDQEESKSLSELVRLFKRVFRLVRRPLELRVVLKMFAPPVLLKSIKELRCFNLKGRQNYH